MRKKESDDHELLKEKGCLTGCSSKSSFNVLDGVREMIQGNYILESWRSSTDSTDAYNDVVSMNQNLGLIAALILTIAIPPGLAANGITDKSTFAEIAYLFCISVVSLTEGLAVLITTRNLIALNALEPENIKAYLSVAQSVLMIPIRLNFVAVLALFGALNMWAYAQNGSYSVDQIPHLCAGERHRRRSTLRKCRQREAGSGACTSPPSLMQSQSSSTRRACH